MIELKTCLEPTDTNCFGAYLNHLAILSEDPTVKSTNRQKLKGYLLQWRSAKMLFGSALFHDLLKPATILCIHLVHNFKALCYPDIITLHWTRVPSVIILVAGTYLLVFVVVKQTVYRKFFVQFRERVTLPQIIRL